MIHTVLIDLDEVGALIRENLDLALPHLTSQAHVNPQAALKTVTAQWSYSDLILRNLDSKYTLEVERFETLRREARGMIAQFWSVYQLFPIERVNGQVVQAQVQQTVPVIKHINGKRGPYKKRHTLTDDQKQEILEYFAKLGRRARKEDVEFVMRTYNISASYVNHVRFEWSR